MLLAMGYELRKHHCRDVFSVTKLSNLSVSFFIVNPRKISRREAQYIISQLCSLLSLYSVEGRKKVNKCETN